MKRNGFHPAWWHAVTSCVVAAALATLASAALMPRTQRSATTATARPPAPPPGRLAARLGQVPLAFENGAGNRRNRFSSRALGYGVSLSADAVVFRLKPAAKPSTNDALRSKPASLRMRLLGADAKAKPQGLERLASTSNYLIGSDPAQWRTDVSQYGKVRYDEVYPGIDAVYYGSQHDLEYDFVVRPGSDPASIALKFDGARDVRLTPGGDLLLSTPDGDLLQHRPIAYQTIAGRRQPVDAAFAIRSDQAVHFRLGAYDHAQALVLDPVLSYSTYLGGNNYDEYTTVAVDAAGNSYVMGMTDLFVDSQVPSTYPVVSPLQPKSNGGWELFISKISAGGDRLVYSTYFGGSGNEMPGGIAVDQDGNAYITGCTESVDFPTRAPIQATLKGTQDVFVTKFNAAGNGLVYSTYVGRWSDCGTGIAVDGSARAYVVGFTQGALLFPPGGAQPLYGGGVEDAFVFRLNAAGSAMEYGTYMGGGHEDNGYGIAVDSASNAYVTGWSNSSNFPVTQGAFQPQLGLNAVSDGYIYEDAFVAKLNATGSAFVYSTYLGGGHSDEGRKIAVDPGGNAYVVGWTAGPFPLVTPMQAFMGARDGFISKLDASGHSLVYSTYLGGSRDDIAQGVAVDASGSAYVVGWTDSVNFPAASPWQQFRGDHEVFVSKIAPSGRDFAWSSYLGGLAGDFAQSIAVDRSGTVHVTGDTDGYFPQVNPLQTYGGNADAFVARISGATPTTAAYGRQDVDDDGYADVIWHEKNTGDTVVWSAARAQVLRRLGPRPDLDWFIAGTGDFNGDHRTDLLWRNRRTGQNELWQSALQSNTRVLSNAYVGWDVVGVGDFNADGKSDILWRNAGSGANIIWSAGNYGASIPVTGVTDLAWTVAGVGDFEGDRHADILWRNTRTGANAMWMNANSATIKVLSPVNLAWTVVGIGDFGGDRRSDILWRNQQDGSNTIWQSGNPAAKQSVTGVTDLAWKIATVADYNGDGKSDIFWRDQDTGANVIWRSASPATSQATQGVTLQSWTVVP